MYFAAKNIAQKFSGTESNKKCLSNNLRSMLNNFDPRTFIQTSNLCFRNLRERECPWLLRARHHTTVEDQLRKNGWT